MFRRGLPILARDKRYRVSRQLGKINDIVIDFVNDIVYIMLIVTQ
jgi:hypothetical protein